MNKVFKVTAEGDQVFISAANLDEAKEKFTAIMGPVPESMLTWEEVDELPEDEEFLA